MEKLRLSNKAFANKLIAILVIFCMIFVQYAIVGGNIVQAVAEELEEQETITKGENVEFNAFFRSDNGSTHEAELNLEETQKLYIEVSVKDKVSVRNAVINIKDANFNIKKDEIKDNRYISKIDTEANEIQLKGISSNNTVLIELPIEFKKQEKINSSYFEKEVNITLKGNTEDISQRVKDLEGSVTVKPLWTAYTELNLTQSIDKYFSLGDKGTILQQTVKSEVKNNALPRYKEVIQTEAPTVANEKPERVTVLVDGEKVDDNNVEYNNGTVKVTYSKIDDSDGNIEWGDAKKEYTFMYHYNSTTPLVETPIKLNTKVESSQYTKDDNVTKEDTTEIVATPIGNITTVETTLTGDIYKGYLYENEAKELQYVERNDIDVSYIEGIENIQLQTNNNTYANEAGIGVISAQNITYKQTQVNKKEILKLLGQEGKVTIKRATGEVITEITKDTQEDEKGVITVEYPEGETGIVIETTKPQVEGKMTVLNTKAISGVTNQPRTAISLIKQLIVNPEIITNVSKEGTTASLEMKEPTTEASIEVNRTSLTTTQENQKIEIKAMLNTNDAKQDLYANPSLAIELPSDIQSVNVESIDKLYGDEFTDVRASQGVVNGKQVIRIDLTGEQKEHKEAGINGTVLNIKANVTLNKKAISKKDNIKMTYTNAKATQYKDAQPIGTAETPLEIIYPKALITTNEIADLQVETFGEQEEVTKTIPYGAGEKVLNIGSKVINNNSSEIKDVKILGTFGTQGTVKIGEKVFENNINSMLVGEFAVNNADMSKVKIYYTENESATDDIEDTNNRWQSTLTNVSAIKKYLVVVSNMVNGEELDINYNVKVPANLEHNQKMYQGYTVKYNDDKTIGDHQVSATTIQLKTGIGQKIEAKSSVKVGNSVVNNNEIVKRGEKIEYNIEISNTGDEDIKNAVVRGIVPEGATLLNSKNEKYYGVYTESPEREVNFEIPEIKAGEKINKSYIVKVNDNAQTQSAINQAMSVEYNGNEVHKSQSTLIVGDIQSPIEATTSYYQDSEVIAGTSLNIGVDITNKTNQEINNVVVTWEMPKGFNMKSNALISDIEAKENTSITYTIDKIEAGQTANVLALLGIDDSVVDGDYPISATVKYNNEVYKTNSADVKVKTKEQMSVNTISDAKDRVLNIGEIVTYKITMKSNRNLSKERVEVTDILPTYMMLKEATLKDGAGNVTNLPIENDGMFSQKIAFAENEEKTLTLKAEVVCIDELYEDEVLKNEISVLLDNKSVYKSEVESTLKANTESEKTNSISGYAWIDANLNGQIDTDEEILSNIGVKLLNVATNEFAKQDDGQEIVEYTDDEGLYTFENVPTGQYIIIFEYDTSLYKTTEYMKEGADESVSSKAISRTIDDDGEKITIGATDVINVQESTQVSNENIGFEEKGKFDLDLDKHISRIVVNNKDGIKTYDYSKGDLAKIELDKKKISGSSVIFEYEIRVSNNGEVAGYAKEIEDTMPSDLTFSSEMNPTWYQSGSALKTNCLENEIIEPGENKTIKLFLTKVMTESNTGMITNTPEITEAYNEDGTIEISSTSGKTTNYESGYTTTSDAIVTTKPNLSLVYTTLLLVIVTLLGAGIFVLKKETIKIDEDIFKGL